MTLTAVRRQALAYLITALATTVLVLGLVAIATYFPHLLRRPIGAYAILLLILASAWWGGYGPGIFATCLTVLGASYLAVPHFRLAQLNYTQTGLLLMVSVLVSTVASGRKKAEADLLRANAMLDQHVRDRTRELERANLALHERETQLVQQAQDLSRSNTDLEHFAYIASHDLQEPIRMIAIYSELIEKRYGTRLDTQGLQFLTTVNQGARRMEELVRDLLMYSRALHGEIKDLEPVDTSDAVREAMLNLEAAVHSTGAAISADCLPVVNGKRTLVLQVFQNLLSNALKYHDGTRPEIVIHAEQCSKDWLFSVQDNGIGIHPDYHETIFDPFKRLHGREYPGTGVGLAVCRRIVERLGGRIWVESEPLHGATFKFTIPV